MSHFNYSDERLEDLRRMPKVIENPNAAFRQQYKYRRKQFQVSGADGERFEVFLRQNTISGMEDDFSCGLLILIPSGVTLILCRYNGSSHKHFNPLEKQIIDRQFHIHKATERYIYAGRTAEQYAELTDRYKTLDGAFHCLVKDCNIFGVDSKPGNLNQIQIPF